MTQPRYTIDYGIYRSLLDVFDHAVGRFADLPMVTCMGTTYSYAQVDALSRKLAAYLQHGLGMRPGQRIAIQLPNLPQYPVAVYAALRAGLVVVNTNPLYTPRELHHQFNDADVEVLIAIEASVPVVEQIRAETPLRQLIVTAAGDLLGAPPSIASGAGSIAFLDALEKGDSLSLQPAQPGPDDLLCLQYTGGTTGLSKGAMLSHRNIVANLLQVKAALKDRLIEAEEVYVVPLPLYHIYAFNLAFALLVEGGHLSVLIPNPRDIDAFVAELEHHRFTGLAGLNTLFVALCQNERFRKLDFSAFSMTSSGGMALTRATAELWQSVTGVLPAEGYGLTETSPTVTMNPLDGAHIGTVGQPLPDTELRVVDADGNELPSGQPGELLIRGPQVMQGYWRKPEETAQALTADGWLRTGDIAVIQDDGFVRIVDRLKDMILVSGFNVYPNEIEDAVVSCPGVLECAAIGVEDEHSGEVVKLFVVRSDPTLEAAALLAWCRENLTSYKCPKHIVFREGLPKSNVGKILRRELREQDAAS